MNRATNAIAANRARPSRSRDICPLPTPIQPHSKSISYPIRTLISIWTYRRPNLGPGSLRNVLGPTHRVLSESQLATLAKHGEERRASIGETLFDIGDESYPFMAIVEGEAAVLDAAGQEIVRHGASGFLGEMNLLSGQTVFLTAVVTQAMRYIAVDRDVLRALLFEDGPLSDLLLSTFMARREALQQVQGVGLEIVGPHSSAATTQMVEF